MIRYLETTAIDLYKSRKVTIKIHAIRIFVETTDNKTKINDSIVVDMTHDNLKRIIEADDHRQVVDHDWPPQLLWLTRNRVCDHIKAMGPNNTLDFIKRIVDECTTSIECENLYQKYIQGVRQ